MWIILATTSVDWIAGRGLSNTSNLHAKKLWVVASITSNLGLLVYFKYSAFAVDNLNYLIPSSASVLGSFVWHGALPLGISFHTFQGISYVIDVYRKDIKPVRSFFEFALFVSFFPQLVAGPIVRAPEFLPQVEFTTIAERTEFNRGIARIIYGMFKKVYIADAISPWVSDAYADPTRFSGLGLLIATVAFAVQIYCDFSGYSDIAIGSASLFGIKLPENFDAPYLSLSIREFWQRWHMSLSRWLRDYLYIPLGGSRCSTPRVYLNLMITMLLGGLWHGSGWNWLVWGGIQGAIMSLERMTGLDKAPSHSYLRSLRWLINILVVLISWVFFRAQSFSHATLVLSRIVQWQNGIIHTELRSFIYAATGFSLILVFERFGFKKLLIEWFSSRSQSVRWLIYASMAILALTFSRASNQEFIYFAF
jgi:D-alanyl-lipoteichoic acid acyltransferase DltB (MBOAT superfamily)